MPRKYIIPKKEVITRRALEWEHHYNARRTVAEVFAFYDPARVASTITREIPPPIMRADGSLLEGLATVRGRAKAAYLLNVDQSQREYMCIWYWSEDGWADFNAQYQNLPDILEDYCLLYDAEIDATQIVPKSQKPPVQVRYKSSTSKALVPRKQAQPAEA